jgi:hypothetical protein
MFHTDRQQEWGEPQPGSIVEQVGALGGGRVVTSQVVIGATDNEGLIV